MNTFENYINGSKPVIVDFYTTWCEPCKLMAPVLKNVKEKVSEYAIILKMDIDKNPSYAQKFQIHSVPTIIIFKEGKSLWRKSGVIAAPQLLDAVSPHI